MSLNPATIKDNILEVIKEEKVEYLTELIEKALDAMYKCGHEDGVRKVIDNIVRK